MSTEQITVVASEETPAIEIKVAPECIIVLERLLEVSGLIDTVMIVLQRIKSMTKVSGAVRGKELLESLSGSNSRVRGALMYLLSQGHIRDASNCLREYRARSAEFAAALDRCIFVMGDRDV